MHVLTAVYREVLPRHCTIGLCTDSHTLEMRVSFTSEHHSVWVTLSEVEGHIHTLFHLPTLMSCTPSLHIMHTSCSLPPTVLYRSSVLAIATPFALAARDARRYPLGVMHTHGTAGSDGTHASVEGRRGRWRAMPLRCSPTHSYPYRMGIRSLIHSHWVTIAEVEATISELFRIEHSFTHIHLCPMHYM